MGKQLKPSQIKLLVLKNLVDFIFGELNVEYPDFLTDPIAISYNTNPKSADFLFSLIYIYNLNYKIYNSLFELIILELKKRLHSIKRSINYWTAVKEQNEELLEKGSVIDFHFGKGKLMTLSNYGPNAEKIVKGMIDSDLADIQREKKNYDFVSDALERIRKYNEERFLYVAQSKEELSKYWLNMIESKVIFLEYASSSKTNFSSLVDSLLESINEKKDDVKNYFEKRGYVDLSAN